MSSSKVEELELEISRLTRELDQTQSEKVQAAEYGINLLEENSKLSSRLGDLEDLYEVTKNELEIMKDALSKTTQTHKITEKSGIQHEESLLSETAALECSLTTQITNYEGELRLTKQELERLKAERDRLITETSELQTEGELTHTERSALKRELKEIKSREGRLLKDYSELEDENLMLQKQVSSLRSSQVEFESAKHEISQLMETEVELLRQVEELAALKRIAEKQLEEALEALQVERENRYCLKKELDAKINSESIMNLSNLALSLRGGVHDEMNDSDSENDDKMVSSMSHDSTPGGGEKQVDLFSEIHLNQMKKLEGERNSLTKSLKEIQDLSDKSKGQVVLLQAALTTIVSHIDALNSLKEKTSQKMVDGKTPKLSTYEGWYTISAKEISQLKASLEALEKADSSLIADVAAVLKSEMTSMKEKLLSSEMTIQEFEIDLRSMDEAAADAHKTLDSTQSDLNMVSEELANLYYKVCNVQGVTPQRVMLEHMDKDGKINSPAKSMGFQGNNFLQGLLGRLRPKNQSPSGNWEGDLTFTKQVETISDQVKTLRDTVLTAVAAGRAAIEAHVVTPGMDSGYESIGTPSMEELQKQICEYRSLVEAKTEQNSALRSVLKANKAAAEKALSNLKGKYDAEKTIVSETMVKLRNELRLLKEDAATFSTLRGSSLSHRNNSIFCLRSAFLC
ncbi:protein bicaudal D isoform X2 [Folsomia candida]|uniref:protein bicaudal D isoform X2 n=1 Tax=Folsomia candida TaxID=158441 RepID=UPI001604DE61|nr:protein bicaudal D isoform X2 [Folsomia candida]